MFALRFLQLIKKKLEGVQDWGGNWAWTPIPNAEVSSNWQLPAKGSELSVLESHWVYNPHLKAGPMPSSRCQHKMNSMALWEFCLIMISLGFFCFCSLLVFSCIFWFLLLCFLWWSIHLFVDPPNGSNISVYIFTGNTLFNIKFS